MTMAGCIFCIFSLNCLAYDIALFIMFIYRIYRKTKDK